MNLLLSFFGEAYVILGFRRRFYDTNGGGGFPYKFVADKELSLLSFRGDR